MNTCGQADIHFIFYLTFVFFFSLMIKDHWNDKVSVATNLNNFGLTNNPNKSIKTGFTTNQPQTLGGEETVVQNKRVSDIF